MFSEFFAKHPIKEMLSSSPKDLFPLEGETAWLKLPAAFREEILREAARYEETPYPMRTAMGFYAFAANGSRRADEEPYFFRRRKLCWAALRCCVDRDAPLDDVIDGVYCVCEETAWVISAHNVNPVPGAPGAAERPLPDIESRYVDLLTAQTGMILAIICRLLENRLNAVSPVIAGRIRAEVSRRILEPFMETDDFWWMGVRRKDLNNWTPWIVSNVMYCACLLPLPKAALAALLERACGMLDRWLCCVPADGGCDEGAGYWNMAGGALLDCLDILNAVTDGKAAFWQDEKIRNILSFPAKAEIGNGWFVNFADCDARPFLSGERLQYAGEKIGDKALAAMGVRLRGSLSAQLSDTPHLSRLMNLLFHPASPALEAEPLGDVWLPDLQLRLVRRDGMTFCCKGGHNSENHNHNDVGSFMLYVDGEPEIVDAGNMTYTAKTFSAQRYTLWNVRAAYHNLPMIGGREQQPGEAYRARDTRYLPDGLSLDIAGAYGEDAGVKALRREMTLDGGKLRIFDSVELKKEAPAAWVFLFRNKPVLSEGVLTAGGVRMRFPAALQGEIEEIPVADPRMARNFPGSLWRVILNGPASVRCQAEFIITRKDRRF